MASYFGAFEPNLAWDELVRWPPDVFALANLVLDQTQAYRFVVAPPHGRAWPPLPEWSEQVADAARSWRSSVDEPPPLVRRLWSVVMRHRDEPLAKLRSGEAWEPTSALLTLHAIGDEACAEVASSGRQTASSAFEHRAWTLLQEQGSLSRLAPTRVRIVPKAQFSGRGITIRSLSRYLALSYEAVEVRWRSVEPGPGAEVGEYNLVLAPWPLSIRGSDFRVAPPALIENMDSELFGFFEFAPEAALDDELLDSVLAAASERCGRVDAVMFPEAALSTAALPAVERALDRHGATFLVTGVHERPAGATFGRNYLHFGIRDASGWRRYEQDKHHRWCLDEPQLRQYHLTRSLDPKKLWWEAIEIRERSLHVVDLGGGVTTAPLVCEDLARLDEVADVVRRIGPCLVVAALLDGPQLSARWSCRYASVLADDPGAAVLTLTAFGMAARSTPPGRRASRVVAHWNSRDDGLHELELGRGAAAVLVSTAVEGSTLWTADGRRHERVPRLRLAGVHQLRAR